MPLFFYCSLPFFADKDTLLESARVFYLVLVPGAGDKRGAYTSWCTAKAVSEGLLRDEVTEHTSWTVLLAAWKHAHPPCPIVGGVPLASLGSLNSYAHQSTKQLRGFEVADTMDGELCDYAVHTTLNAAFQNLRVAGVAGSATLYMTEDARAAINAAVGYLPEERLNLWNIFVELYIFSLPDDIGGIIVKNQPGIGGILGLIFFIWRCFITMPKDKNKTKVSVPRVWRTTATGKVTMLSATARAAIHTKVTSQLPPLPPNTKDMLNDTIYWTRRDGRMSTLGAWMTWNRNYQRYYTGQRKGERIQEIVGTYFSDTSTASVPAAPEKETRREIFTLLNSLRMPEQHPRSADPFARRQPP
ncbi:hypothetical protein C8R45DRAFT_920588 [Mycena sanguinolenta]|nr:hypothetical protein C8R45DRAFT_920588 [Mycena sanguinolenta]